MESASDDMSASEDQTCATLKPDEQNLRKTYSDSDQDPNHVISTQKRQNKLKPRTLWSSLAKHSEASTLLYIQDRLITNDCIPRQRSSKKRKERYEHWNGIMDSNVSIPCYLNKSVRKEMANTLHAYTHLS